MYQQARDIIKKIEGLRLKAYLCPAGYPTIGYGHRVASLNVPAITVAQAEEYLTQDIAKFVGTINRQVANAKNLNEEQMTALISLVYSIGSFTTGSGLLNKLTANIDDPTIPDKIKEYDNQRNATTGALEYSEGLHRRRVIEADLYLLGIKKKRK